MPISEFQKQVLLLLKEGRNPESYVAGGTAIQRASDSIRYSQDIDFFHDTDEAVTESYQNDRAQLVNNSYSFQILISQPSFYRAVVAKGQKSLKLEWVRDTAFRFFPVVEDDELGFRLHDVDLSVNKCLALANRIAIRDLLDIVQISDKNFSLASCIWAGCGKDPGFTPELMLEMIQRHAIINPVELAAQSLVKSIDPKKLKKQINSTIAQAKSLIKSLPPKDLGCVYLSSDGKPISLSESNLRKIRHFGRHFGTVKGSWPRVVFDA